MPRDVGAGVGLGDRRGRRSSRRLMPAPGSAASDRPCRTAGSAASPCRCATASPIASPPRAGARQLLVERPGCRSSRRPGRRTPPGSTARGSPSSPIRWKTQSGNVVSSHSSACGASSRVANARIDSPQRARLLRERSSRASRRNHVSVDAGSPAMPTSRVGSAHRLRLSRVRSPKIHSRCVPSRPNIAPRLPPSDHVDPRRPAGDVLDRTTVRRRSTRRVATARVRELVTRSCVARQPSSHAPYRDARSTSAPARRGSTSRPQPRRHHHRVLADSFTSSPASRLLRVAVALAEQFALPPRVAQLPLSDPVPHGRLRSQSVRSSDDVEHDLVRPGADPVQAHVAPARSILYSRM